jgi:trehalose 6-phosphate phosphatase
VSAVARIGGSPRRRAGLALNSGARSRYDLGMKSILSPRHRSLLGDFAGSDPLVVLDYDGTLAPIVADPKRAVLRRGTRALLSRLAAARDCVILSGRSRKDLLRFLKGIPTRELIGNHGIEWKTSSASELERLARKVDAWRPVLRDCLAEARGVAIEDKRFSVSLHYRHAPDKERALRLIDRALSRLRSAHSFDGKDVINVMPRGAMHKGLAVLRLRKLYPGRRIVFVGDDVTDEHAFALGDSAWFLGIRVGKRGKSLARYSIDSQARIDALLRALLPAEGSKVSSPRGPRRSQRRARSGTGRSSGSRSVAGGGAARRSPGSRRRKS